MRDAARAPLGHPVVVHLTVAERVALGRAARSRLARSSHAAFDPPASRPDPVELLESQAADRVPSLLPIRYGRMVGSPFGFFRGAAVIMAGDLAASPDTGLRVQLCGDAHLSNFGVFASPERRLVFDLNDFDETSPGPFEWDVKRLAASLAVAGRENGFSPKDRRMVAGDAVAGYRQAMRRFARLPTLDVWYARLEVDDLLAQLRGHMAGSIAAGGARAAARARDRDSMSAHSKLVHLVDGEPRIVSDPPLVEPIGELFGPADREALSGLLHELLRSYRESLRPDRRALVERFRLVDAARKVVGVGSVGTRCWVALFVGRDLGDPLFLPVKEAESAVGEPFLGASEFSHHG
ncbi:MAG TPA: DUF2252 family protein, partial [Gaiellales bacterium]|nr:DUF2252 family protein [Gaiellales bacterium]